MAEGLKTFIEGEDILASETNDNNRFLLNRISENAQRLENIVNGEITSIQSNISSVQTTLQNSINAMSDKLNAELGSMYENIAPNYSAGISITTGWTATSSGWLYMGGTADGTSSFTIDGVSFQISYDTGDGQSNGNIFMYIAKDSVISDFRRVRQATFYPCKGVKNA